MAINMKDKQAQYDKCMAQSAQYKFQCPSRCLAHNLLHRLLKKLGEHHILALLVEPKILEEPDVRVEKIIQTQNNFKKNTPQPQKRPLHVQNGYHNNSTTKKPRNGHLNGGYQHHLRTFYSSNGVSTASRSLSNAEISAIKARSTKSFSPATSLPSSRPIAPYRPQPNVSQPAPPPVKSSNIVPKPAPSTPKFSTPCLVPQVSQESVKQNGDCQLKLRNNGAYSYFAKSDSPNTIPSLPQRRYEISQGEIGITKVIFNTEKNGSDYKLSIQIYRYGNAKKFKFFGMAFRDHVDAKWRCTAENILPDDRVVSVLIPLSNVTSRLAVFSIWFGRYSNPDVIKNCSPEIMCAPIMVDLYSETGKKYIATFEPDFVEIDDD